MSSSNDTNDQEWDEIGNEIDPDDTASNVSNGIDMETLIERRFNRRDTLKGMAASLAAASVSGLGGLALSGATAKAAGGSTLRFEEAPHVITDNHQTAPGHQAQVLIRFGDKVVPDAPEWEVGSLDGAAQEKQFGYNCDFVSFMPLPAGSNNSDHGLLCTSHEYTNGNLMWPEQTKRGGDSAEKVSVELAAHGHSIVEIKRDGDDWNVLENSAHNRRLTMNTPMRIAGPAAGHARMKTSADPSGKRVLGTLNNCAGGTTPWGTVLIGEENIQNYFNGDPKNSKEAAGLKRMGVGKPRYNWGDYHDRFNVEKEQNEFNRFGWIVEFDPYDPTAVPVKRTALGRFKHEGATVIINKDGRVVAYSGDDQRFEYLYKFVSHGRYDPNNRAANRDLLDSGTLFVAKFSDDGTMRWLPIVFGTGPLTAENGFSSQGDVLIDTRRAADLLGATPMDRPEDVEPNPVNGRVYVMLTNNSKRKPDQTDAVNSRAKNSHGQILELIPPGGSGTDADHGAQAFKWDLLLLAGNPKDPKSGARYHSDITEAGWMSSPDNCAFDNRGRLWITTDQGSKQAKNNIPDGVYACDLDGPGRALTRFFFAVPRGAEMCGPCFTPDNSTLFVAVQHPGEAKGSTFEKPSTRWPDFKDDTPPRPSVVAIRRKDGGVIG